jgi:hypothetical protein
MRAIALKSCLAATLILAVGASTASAATLFPSSANFGTQEVNTVSPRRSFVLTAQATDMLLPLTISTTGDYSQTNNCPSQIGFQVTSSCTIHVSFRPTRVGTRRGALSTTTPLVGGPTASLTGVGDAARADNQGAGQKCKKAWKKKGNKSATAAAKKKGKKCKKRKGKKK